MGGIYKSMKETSINNRIAENNTKITEKHTINFIALSVCNILSLSFLVYRMFFTRKKMVHPTKLVLLFYSIIDLQYSNTYIYYEM